MSDGKGFILALLAETPLHPGAGQSAGVVDLPVSREGATGLPQIPETGLKGALRQWAQSVYDETDEAKKGFRRLFGSPDVEMADDGSPVGGAGELLISTARLLFLPVRRLDAAYAWVTSPYLLERLGRDAERSIRALEVPAICADRDKLLVPDGAGQRVFLEEYVFTTQSLGDQKETLDKLIDKLVDPSLRSRLKRQAAVMHDDEFAWFAENALPVDARNSLDESKMSQNLWYEETLPPDTLLYTVILPRSGATGVLERFSAFKEKLQQAKYIQAGGNETVGHGWLRVTIVEA